LFEKDLQRNLSIFYLGYLNLTKNELTLFLVKNSIIQAFNALDESHKYWL